VDEHASTTHQFKCPKCGAENRFATTARRTTEKFELKIPSWWQKTPPMGESELLSVSGKTIDLIQRLVDKTWKDVTTRDRSYGKVARLRIVQVQQNHNPKLWANYCKARESIRESLPASRGKLRMKTTDFLASDPDGALLGLPDAGVNEGLLFHGTKPSACESICKSDFMLTKAGTGAGSLYGPGVYFGENSSKSDEYATDDTSGIWSGLFAMLLCRVTCGNALVCADVAPDVAALTRACAGERPQNHCVVGDREKARGTYREFIVYNSDQAYPEYVVIYRREQ